jgi:hypothetical protein
MIRIEIGAEIDGPKPTDGRRHGIFEYHAAGWPEVRGYSRQPLLDACRQLARMGAASNHPVGMFWPGRTAPSLTCTVAAGAALTITEDRGPRFVRYREGSAGRAVATIEAGQESIPPINGRASVGRQMAF